MPTPHEWLRLLEPELDRQAGNAKRWDRYYTGEHPIPGPENKAKQAYRRLLAQARSNWCELVVNSTEERLNVIGFSARQRSDAVEADAWELWDANELDLFGPQAILETLISGHAYAIAYPDHDHTTGVDVVLAPELPSQVTIAYGSHLRQPEAALKRYTDRDDVIHAILFLDRLVIEFTRDAKKSSEAGWAVADTRSNPFGRVPVVELKARPRLDRRPGRSELASAFEIQDRINETLFNRLLAQQYASWRQRWATGLTLEIDETTGEVVEPFDTQVDRLWVTEEDTVRFGEFGEHNLRNYIDAVESDIQHLAAITRTPPHYLLGQSGAFPSGESLKSTETGLVAKVRDHHASIGHALGQLVRLGLRLTKEQDPGRIRTIWADPESRSDGELVDALLKLKSLGIPDEAIWARVPGATPEDVRAWRAQAARARLNATPLPTPPPSTPTSVAQPRDRLPAAVA